LAGAVDGTTAAALSATRLVTGAAVAAGVEARPIDDPAGLS
jgi:hypothetical protein